MHIDVLIPVLLNDGHFIKCFNFWVEQWRVGKSQFASLKQWWAVGKIQIQQFCNQYLSIQVTSVVELKNLGGSTEDRGHIHALKDKNGALADLLGYRAQGALVRSCFQNIAEMDTPSKCFFNLKKKNGQNRLIHCIHQLMEVISLSQLK